MESRLLRDSFSRRKKCLNWSWRVAARIQHHCRHRIILIIFMRFKELIHSLFLMNRCLQLSPIYDTYFTVSRQSYDFKTKRFLESMFKTTECNNQNKQTWNKVPRLCFNSENSLWCVRNNVNNKSDCNQLCAFFVLTTKSTLQCIICLSAFIESQLHWSGLTLMVETLTTNSIHCRYNIPKLNWIH